MTKPKSSHFLVGNKQKEKNINKFKEKLNKFIKEHLNPIGLELHSIDIKKITEGNVKTNYKLNIKEYQLDDDARLYNAFSSKENRKMSDENYRSK